MGQSEGEEMACLQHDLNRSDAPCLNDKNNLCKKGITERKEKEELRLWGEKMKKRGKVILDNEYGHTTFL